MKNRLILVLAALLVSISAFAQAGGVKATVVNRNGRAPISNARVLIVDSEANVVVDATANADGTFLFDGLADGNYRLTVSANGFNQSIINLKVEGYVKDLIFVSLISENASTDIDDSAFAEFDMEDSGYTDTPTILFNANDPYNNIVGYGFSDVKIGRAHV